MDAEESVELVRRCPTLRPRILADEALLAVLMLLA